MTASPPRRRFNATERTVLFLAADGRCSHCGTELQPSWHGDHVNPYSAGGPTDIINGQALCPTCNLKKGRSVVKGAREWQNQAHDKFFANATKDYLVSATPGAGKTYFALKLAKRLIQEHTAERIIVVVPTDALRLQWADSAGNVGLNLMPVTDPEDYGKPGYQGYVVTYAQVARGIGSEKVRYLTRRPTVALLDEIHHAGENKSWGEGLTQALEHAVHRIALTGTPWRKDGASPIPFVRYDRDGKVEVDYAYEYGTAVADGVCRRIEFHAYDGEAKWTDCGKVSTAALGGELADDDIAAALDAVLEPTHKWIPALLAQANTALDELRTEVPDAGGLVVAHEKWHARAYANLLRQLTGESPIVVLSDDPEAKDNIDRFREARSKWLVAVRMVSEGVDIPRLAVGVYATKIRTPLFFRQVVGRFVRIREDEEFNARLFIPAIPSIMEHGRAIEEELRHQLEIEAERVERVRDSGDSGGGMLDLRIPLDATEAVFDRAIVDGDEVTPVEVAKAAAWLRANGIPSTYAVNAARGLRSAPVGAVAVVENPKPTPAPAPPRHRAERMLRGEIDTLVGKLAYRRGMPKKDVNLQLIREGWPTRSKATVEQLRRQKSHLMRILGES
ncbi:DEAD/DEAH box helicase family protein [Streptomyces dysideae]|uniref:Helicase ATP-binding domain-containing protein n=1 Tax=Streptomyces dysideae TaxID=909626 RepID=A0A101V1Q2_9ACTN|nr:DEAD/DEAH box helicase family protein [Streptomyces dysideae]KUO20848.1 hypothetical protein AQJ91_13195 [Streptomyces dysideae]